MAFTTQDSNWIAEEIAAAQETLALRDKLRNIVARWNNNDMFNQLQTEDIEAAFDGINKAEVTAAINAFNAVITALGDDTTGQASNLFKLVL
jgi:hypothetical protein